MLSASLQQDSASTKKDAQALVTALAQLSAAARPTVQSESAWRLFETELLRMKFHHLGKVGEEIGETVVAGI
jgi:hypothetical protein